jgi:hypothetical protein
MGRICCHATGPFVVGLPAEELAQLVNSVVKRQTAEQFVRRVLLACVGELAQLVDPDVSPAGVLATAGRCHLPHSDGPPRNRSHAIRRE